MKVKLSLTINADTHKKIKVIAALTDKTFNSITESLYQKFIADYEAEHGEIKVPD